MPRRWCRRSTQFDSTIDGKAIKIASMVDVRRTHPRVAAEPGGAFDHRRAPGRRAGEGVRRCGWPAQGAANGQRSGDGFPSAATVLREQTGMVYIPPGCPWDNGYIESFNNRPRKECLNRNYWNTLFEARVVIGDFKDDHNHRHRHSALVDDG
ncbi:hypothetical protein C6A85_83590 [Mycobacterium sp. ITM-2017-0098]|nr:hypothetical protein C6A85_83590 [Mycobacterium sp. ITM-2017-0098]